MCKEGNACHKGERDAMEDKYVKVGKAAPQSRQQRNAEHP